MIRATLGGPARAPVEVSSMDRRSLVVGALVGGALVAFGMCLALSSAFPTAGAEEPPVLGGPPQDPMTPTSPGPTVNPINGPNLTRAAGGGGSGFGMGGANQTAIALSAPVGGESVVYYFDTEQQRLLVYQYQSRGDKSGLRLLAARHFDYDLKLDDYVTSPTRSDLKAAYEAAFTKSGGRSGELPAKRVEFDPGK
jgi:hypothetical protein